MTTTVTQEKASQMLFSLDGFGTRSIQEVRVLLTVCAFPGATAEDIAASADLTEAQTRANLTGLSAELQINPGDIGYRLTRAGQDILDAALGPMPTPSATPVRTGGPPGTSIGCMPAPTSPPGHLTASEEIEWEELRMDFKEALAIAPMSPMKLTDEQRALWEKAESLKLSICRP